MSTHVDKTQQNRTQIFVNEPVKRQNSNNSTSKFVDNRLESITQRKFEEVVNGSSRVQQFKAYEEMAYNSLQVKQMKGFQVMSDHYANKITQRKENLEEEPIQGKFGEVQKIAGNIPTALNTNSLSPAEQAFQGTSTVQLKKTEKPDSEGKYDALIVALGNDVKQNVLAGKISKKDKSDAIWDEAVTVFNTNTGKGEGYMANIDAAIVKYQNPIVPGEDGAKSPKQTLIDQNVVKRTEYNKKFRENYAHAPTEDLGAANKYRVNTKGYDPVDGPAPVVPQGNWEGDYSNEVNFADNSITAKWNMAANMNNDDWTVAEITDEALKAGKGVNNSEILWQQYKMAAEEKYKASGTKDTDVAAALKRMSRIKRDTVINSETLVTVYMAYDEGKNWQDDDEDFMPGTEEFNAVVATPNAKSSVFMLIDHIDEIEKTVEKISASTGGLDIVFGAI